MAVAFKNKIPNHSYSGLRYNPSYLFDFLQNPQKIRRHLGVARMPDFHFSEQEALAITLFLETQNKLDPDWPEYPKELFQTKNNAAAVQVPAVEDSVCSRCHSLNGKRGGFAVDFSTIGYRLNPEWVRRYLVAPRLFGIPETTMPEVFYRRIPGQSKFVEKIPDAAQKINQVVNHLFSLGRVRRAQLEEKFRLAKNKYPNLTAGLGEKIYRSQNCSACHDHRVIKPSLQQIAPDLTLEQLRVNRHWLISFLAHQRAIRPFGFVPGSGSRMPDFSLPEGMATNVVDFLMTLTNAQSDSLKVLLPKKLSAFSMKKAKYMLDNRLPCLGCHRLGNRGGRIGPDLSSVFKRLNPFYIYNQIRAPQETSPNTIMPKIPIPEKNLELIYSYLYQQTVEKEETSYLPLTQNDLLISSATDGTEKNYLRYCAVCHGRDGLGKGFNASFLPVTPTKHGDAEYMSHRPDDTLYDGIFAGGFILNKSQFMPQWGLTLKSETIGSLVEYIRKLCNCTGPSWSLDDAPVK